MKKLCVTVFIICGVVATSFAQDAGKIMVGLGGGILAPACTNCSSLSGFDLSGAYQLKDKIVLTLDLGFYSKTDGPSKLNSTMIGISGDYYFKGAYNGFYLGPDISSISLGTKYNGTDLGTSHNLTIGINAGWAIVVADSWRIKPHFGYGTWFDGSQGRITAGLQVGFILP
jgi:hypothetical protein